MRQHHRKTVKPILIILVVLSTGAAITLASDWINRDDTHVDENLFNQDQSLGDGRDGQLEAFAPITSDGLGSSSTNVGIAMAQETALGATNASVTIIEYGTYGCQICRQVHQQGLIERLLADFPNDVAYIYVSWPIYHPNDELATEAVFCAQDQGKDSFWIYHDALFDLSVADYNGYDQASDYVALAEQVDVDGAALGVCLESGKFREAVYELAEYGYELGLPGTPAFFVNGKLTRSYNLETAVRGILVTE